MSPEFPATGFGRCTHRALKQDEDGAPQWSARALDATQATAVRIRYFEPERRTERCGTCGHLPCQAITPLTTPAEPYRGNDRRLQGPPALANDPDLTPKSRRHASRHDRRLDPPFHSTIAAFGPDESIGPITGQHRKRLSRWPRGPEGVGQPLRQGDLAACSRRPRALEEILQQELLQQCNSRRRAAGLSNPIPVKRQQLAASKGTTPFDGLSWRLQFFIIAAALLLVALLFRLGVEQRSAELGTLLALGLKRRHVSRLFVLEGAAVSALGGLIGLAVGIATPAWFFGIEYLVGRCHHHAISAFLLDWRSLSIGYALGVVSRWQRSRECLGTATRSGETASRGPNVGYEPPRLQAAAVPQRDGCGALGLAAACSSPPYTCRAWNRRGRLSGGSFRCSRVYWCSSGQLKARRRREGQRYRLGLVALARAMRSQPAAVP